MPPETTDAIHASDPDERRRVVVTGLGIASSLGCRPDDVTAALREGRSGLRRSEEMPALGLSCHVHAPVAGWSGDALPRRAKHSMSDVALYAATSAVDALDDAGLSAEDLPKLRTGAIVGTSFSGISVISSIHRILRTKHSPSRAGSGGLLKFMNSTASGNLASLFGLHGRCYGVSSAFASGVDNIGHAYETIVRGVHDVCLAGASEEDVIPEIAVYFDNLAALPTDYNDRPEAACRPYDARRQGFVFSSGAGVLVLESLEHARRRGARIYAEIVGYGSSNDGDDMFRPSGKGLRRALRTALSEARRHGVERIDYVNTHGTGTPLGDRVEIAALRDVLPESPPISSTKGLAGHAMGAAGAVEAVFALLMLNRGFLAPTANLETIAEDCRGANHVTELVDRPLESVMSFNVGLGGANACLVFRRLD